MTRILIAGIGNIFNADDAFGVEVVRLLSQRPLPAAVRVIDFGIRGIDLIYALLDPYDAVILVDAAPRGEPPGTISVIAPEPREQTAASVEDLVLSAHELDPANVLSIATALGGSCKRVLLVACEPLDLGGEQGAMGLTPPVAAAVEPAVEMIEQLIADLLGKEPATQALPLTRYFQSQQGANP